MAIGSSHLHVGRGREYFGPTLCISHSTGENIVVQLCVIAVEIE